MWLIGLPTFEVQILNRVLTLAALQFIAPSKAVCQIFVCSPQCGIHTVDLEPFSV